MAFNNRKWILCTIIWLALPSFGICEQVKIAYSNYSTSIVITNVVKAVLQEKLDYSIEMIDHPSDQLWEIIAAGKADLMVSAWLPKSHAAMQKKYQDRVDILKPVTLGIQIGFVVPTYVTIDRIDHLVQKANQFDNKIYCIKDHIGSVEMAKQAIDMYGLKGVEYVLLSEQDLLKKIEQSVKKLEWIA
ncbi:MAG: hypothetical protein HQK75_16910, partial [Candidatus Magnetomorum sp.]|nr:hypothetical protein [Candidatus Magnetomorum sp.]